jgi:hypothetical protein
MRPCKGRLRVVKRRSANDQSSPGRVRTRANAKNICLNPSSGRCGCKLTAHILKCRFWRLFSYAGVNDEPFICSPSASFGPGFCCHARERRRLLQDCGRAERLCGSTRRRSCGSRGGGSSRRSCRAGRKCNQPEWGSEPLGPSALNSGCPGSLARSGG